MIHCPHRHPYGETYCTECIREKAVREYRQRDLAALNSTIEKLDKESPVRAELIRLRDEWHH